MCKKVELVRRIAEHGSDGIPCGRCPLSMDGDPSDTYLMPGVKTDSPEIKAQAQAWLEERAKRKAEKKAKEPESITVDGEVYGLGDKFRWLGPAEGKTLKIGDIGVISSIGSGVAFIRQNGEYFPLIKSCWQRVTEEPSWDGKFVPGEFYEVRGGLIILSDSVTYDSRHVGTVIIKATVIKAVEHYSVGQYVEIYGTGIIRPVKVKITVEE